MGYGRCRLAAPDAAKGEHATNLAVENSICGQSLVTKREDDCNDGALQRGPCGCKPTDDMWTLPTTRELTAPSTPGRGGNGTDQAGLKQDESKLLS